MSRPESSARRLFIRTAAICAVVAACGGELGGEPAPPDAGTHDASSPRADAGRVDSSRPSVDGPISRDSSEGTCGRCDGVCWGSRCLVTLADTSAYTSGLAVDSTSVYWTSFLYSSSSGGSILKIGLTGGSVTTLAAQQPDPYGIAVDETHAYWTNATTSAGPGSVVSVPLTGGTPVTLAQQRLIQLTQAIGVNASSVYWVANAVGGGIVTLAKGGGPPVTIVTGYASNISTDATSIYWTSSYDGTVMKTALAGGIVTTLASGQNPNGSSAMGIALDATSVYWANHDGILKVPVNGGTLTTLATADGPGVIGLDDSSVYWSGGTSSGVILKVPVGGGAVTTLAPVQPGSTPDYAWEIVADATSLYWTTVRGQLMKLTPK